MKNLKEYIIKNNLIEDISWYYGFRLRKNNDTYIFSMCKYYLYDFYVGEGKTIDEAIKNAKMVMTAYDKGYKYLKEKLESMTLISED